MESFRAYKVTRLQEEDVEASSIHDILQSLLSVFLPVGYPNSVTPDYINYQIYVLAAQDIRYSSYLTNIGFPTSLLKQHSRASLVPRGPRRSVSSLSPPPPSSPFGKKRDPAQAKTGVGVGDASASPTAAIILRIFQDSAGRVATILFAHRLSSALEPECKMWRLAADVFNDAAMVLDCLSPALPKTPRVFLLSVSSVLRSLCGVAAGSAKASLSAHFAKWGNLGELNAKDSSQETVISLIGMLVGSIVVGFITSAAATWACLLVLLSAHLYLNYTAVRAVSMRTLNRQRANLVFSHVFDADDDDGASGKWGTILTPKQVSARERIFEYDGVLRWKGGPVLARAKIGASLRELAALIGEQHPTTSSSTGKEAVTFQSLLDVFRDEAYVLWLCPVRKQIVIVLAEDAGARSQLKAWAHALLLARFVLKEEQDRRGKAKEKGKKGKGKWKEKERALPPPDASYVKLSVQTLLRVINSGGGKGGRAKNDWEKLMDDLSAAGWDVDTANLETISGTRIRSSGEASDDNDNDEGSGPEGEHAGVGVGVGEEVPFVEAPFMVPASEMMQVRGPPNRHQYYY